MIARGNIQNSRESRIAQHKLHTVNEGDRKIVCGPLGSGKSTMIRSYASGMLLRESVLADEFGVKSK